MVPASVRRTTEFALSDCASSHRPRASNVLLAINANIVDNESPGRNSTRTDRAIAARTEFNNEHVARIDLVIRSRLVTARVVDTTARAEGR